MCGSRWSFQGSEYYLDLPKFVKHDMGLNDKVWSCQISPLIPDIRHHALHCVFIFWIFLQLFRLVFVIKLKTGVSPLSTQHSPTRSYRSKPINCLTVGGEPRDVLVSWSILSEELSSGYISVKPAAIAITDIHSEFFIQRSYALVYINLEIFQNPVILAMVVAIPTTSRFRL